jgi:uncharacterized repeat protein (TIGR03806 family)
MRPALLVLALAVLPLLGHGEEKPVPDGAPEVEPTAELPEGFTETVVATGLDGATAMEVAPDGRVFVCEQTGALRVVKNDVLLPAPFVTLKVDSFWERGLLGVALDPAFPEKPHVYVCYVAPASYPHHRVSRFTARGDVAAPDSEVVLWKGDDQTKLGGAQPAGHQGGAIHFGKDGKLYVALGEQTAGKPSQRLDTFQGKLLRLNPDGSIPEDNPFFKTAEGKYRAIWALGLRNPFAFAVQPGTGRIFINDVGDARWEEINEGMAGANYGWPLTEGPTTQAEFRGPIHAYDHGVGRSITGGAFCNAAERQFPAEYVGKYFFADYMDNWVRVLDPDDPRSVTPFATGLQAPVDLKFAPDGSLYVLNRRMWVKDGKYKPNTGSLHRIRYTANSKTPAPTITVQPTDAVVAEGQKATLHIEATGEGPLRYQWSRNGSAIPGATSPRYELPAPKAADDGAVFRCVVSNALGKTRSRKAAVSVTALAAAVDAGKVVPGLDYQCVTAPAATLPVFDALKTVREGTVSNVDLSPGEKVTNAAFTFQGFLHIEAEGAYTFTLATDGEAKLLIGPAEVARIGAANKAHETSGAVGLQAGKHPLRLLFAPGGGRRRLQVLYSGPDTPRQPIPDAFLFRPDPASLPPPVIAPAGGTFTGPVRVTMTAPPGTVVRFTTDGTPPDRRSHLYDGPFSLARSTRLMARAFRGDANDPTETSAANFEITGKAPYGMPRREVAFTANIPGDPAHLPPLLSLTGLFASLRELKPNPGVVPYDVNTALWSDGAEKMRWIVLPGEARVEFKPTGEWRFPPGTVFVKHFEINTDDANPRQRRRLETRLLVVNRGGSGYGATFRWRDNQEDADLLPDGATEEFTVNAAIGPQKRRWTYPGRNECLQCHTTAAGFVLGVKTRQLNRPFTYPETGITDNQLRAWNHLRLFTADLAEADLVGYSKLAALSDARAPLEERVRSYLDANCGNCHRPGGTRGQFDARFDTPLARQNLIRGPLVSTDLDLPGSKLIVPGNLKASMVYQRINRRHDLFNMPPLGTHEIDREAVAVFGEWIGSLGNPPK